jgi:hypothetical protein
MAWKPWSKHSTVIRSGFGIYYIPSVYSSLITQLDSQTPFATAFNLTNTCGATIQNAFNLPYSAVGRLPERNRHHHHQRHQPDFRVGYTSNWQFYVQQNLMANTVASVTYFGVKGTALTQQLYPNTSPALGQRHGSLCYPGCASGYIARWATCMRRPTATASPTACSCSCSGACAPAWAGTSLTRQPFHRRCPQRQHYAKLAGPDRRTRPQRRHPRQHFELATTVFHRRERTRRRAGERVGGRTFPRLDRDAGLVLASGAPITITRRSWRWAGRPTATSGSIISAGRRISMAALNPAAFADPPAG